MLRALASTLLLAGMTSVASAQVTPIVTESFEYTVPGVLFNNNGGTGWSNAWWVSGAANDDIVMFDNTIMPMFPLSDGLGGHAGQAAPFGEAFRQIDVNAHPELIDPVSGRWGADGETIWISFSTVNYQGQPQEHYGGLSLWQAGATDPERLFLGSPWNSMGWGIDDEGGNGNPEVIVPGTNDTIAARLVYRIDFMPGMDRVRLYIDPAVDYPTSGDVLDEMIADLNFNEIRLSSGGNNGDAYFWDNIVFAKGTPTGGIGTNYCIANPNSTGVTADITATGSADVAMNNVTLTASNMPTNAFGFFLVSDAPAQVANPGGSLGNLCLGGAIGRYVGPGQIMNAGSAGEFSLVLDLTMTPRPTGAPIAIQPGETWYYTTWHRDLVNGVSQSNFTNGVQIDYQ